MFPARISNRHWSYLVIGLCSLGGHAIFVIPYSYGILQVYIYSYLYQADDKITQAQMHIHAPLVLCIATGTAWSFGLFVKFVHPIILHVANGVALCGWMLLLYFFTDNYIVITVSMAFVGFHVGQLHIFFSLRVTEEGKSRTAAANGFYGFWFGVAGIWGNLLGFFYFNPKNLPNTEFTAADGKNGTMFEQEVILDKVPTVWLILFGVLFVCFLPGYFVIGVTRKGRIPSVRAARFPSKRRGRSDSVICQVIENTYGLEDEITESEEVTAPGRRRRGMRRTNIKTNEIPSQMSNKRKNYLVRTSDVSVVSGVGVALFTSAVGVGISSLCAFELFKEFGTSGEHDATDDRFFNLAGIVIPIVGAFGTILWGVLGDKVTCKVLFIIGNVTTVILQVSMAPSRVDKRLYLVIVSALSIMPGMITLLPPAIKHFMGTKDIGLKYGLLLTGEVFGCMYYLLFASVLRKYMADMVLMTVLSVPSALALLPAVFLLKSEETESEDEPTLTVLRSYMADMVLMTALSVPSALALLPDVFLLKSEETESESEDEPTLTTVLENMSAVPGPVYNSTFKQTD